ncbi:hypothetical protein CRE_31449 [Caenorhabditis remanei]|uniref:Protein kinase domain-containing protein n=1 Tax=Caenorhabditis remanei TaxID=31234 RepID=E3NAB5_CAERE|nr:hypothetical protein CRE_31449 [Caenorhabditis remanei]
MTKATDQNSCQTAEAIGTRESKTNLLVIDGLPNLNSTDATENGGNTTDMEHSGHSDYPDLPKGGGGATSDEITVTVTMSPYFQKYLQKTPNIPNKQIILFALDISKAMCHLASKSVIHRDLAARNCLITKDVRVKLSDFGLSVHGKQTVVKNLRKAPIRWLSPETLSKGIFNEKTDVWSYGVLCTELMTRCAADPLAPRDLKEAQKWIKEADHPHRIDGGEPRELIEIVDYCCEKSPSARPDFMIVRNKVHKLHQKFADLELAHALSPNPNVTPPPQTPSPNPVEKVVMNLRSTEHVFFCRKNQRTAGVTRIVEATRIVVVRRMRR